MATVKMAARPLRPGITFAKYLHNGANTTARTTPQKTAPKNGQRIQAKARLARSRTAANVLCSRLSKDVSFVDQWVFPSLFVDPQTRSFRYPLRDGKQYRRLLECMLDVEAVTGTENTYRAYRPGAQRKLSIRMARFSDKSADAGRQRQKRYHAGSATQCARSGL